MAQEPEEKNLALRPVPKPPVTAPQETDDGLQLLTVLQGLATTPAIEESIKAIAIRITAGGDLERLRQEQEHQRLIDNQARSWEQAARNHRAAFWLLVLWTVLGSGLVVAGVVAIYKNILTRETAQNFGILIGAMFFAVVSKLPRSNPK